DPERRAKGYALQYAFAISRTLGWAEAVVVVDADSEVSPHLLEAFAARLERGAPAVQARYGVLNPMDSWRTRLITVAKACFHDVRSRARERLALSCGIRGNGWCVPHRTLHRVPYRAFSLAEDVEYGLALGRAGLRVHYADEAAVLGEMVSGERAARSQRRRWEHGRAQLRAQVPSLLRRGTPVALDLALDLLLMPLAWVALSIVVTGAAAWWLHAEAALWAAAACGATLALHVARGAQLTGLGWDAATALLHVPGFVLWKLWVMVPGRAASAPWLRTERENAGRVARP
ncbi:MAG TPA: glycosyltransferase family 2 protein, partial [Candidatus Binatia bacterium]|nr:glycosyltransferase family 2 protein [Candidatus Binatia bacterium]